MIFGQIFMYAAGLLLPNQLTLLLISSLFFTTNDGMDKSKRPIRLTVLQQLVIPCQRKQRQILAKGTREVEKELEIIKYIRIQKYVRAMMDMLLSKEQKA